jgi:hypothetical protein
MVMAKVAAKRLGGDNSYCLFLARSNRTYRNLASIGGDRLFGNVARIVD